MSYDYSGDYYEPLFDDLYDAKSTKKSAKTPKRANRGRTLRECFLPIASACRSGETCRRIRFRGSNGKWTTSGPLRVRGVCVTNGRCLPRNVLQEVGRNTPPFEELARNCCQPNRTKNRGLLGAGRTWVACR